MTPSTLVRRSESQAVLIGIVLVVAAAWAALLAGPSGGQMIICGAADGLASGTDKAVNLLAMWLVMTPAMMLPAAALDIVSVSSGRIGQRSLTAALNFAAGYLVVVSAASIAAAGLQWFLQSAALLTDNANLYSRTAGGTLLAVVGFYQLSGLKRVSMERCHHLRQHNSDPMVVGLRHGLACIDCCAVMICLQFVVGVMNVAWMAALVAWMIAERLLPFRMVLARLSGMALIVCGGILAIA